MTAAFWIGAAALILLALAFLLVPWWQERRQGGETGPSGLLTALAIAPVAVGLYFLVSTYDPDADQPSARAEDLALLEQLATRLGQNPDDVEGWMLLGRSYRALQDYGRARMAFEQVWERSENPDNMLKLLYAESMLFSDPATAAGQAGELIDEVLASAPGNQSALLLGGIAAAESGSRGLAGERFTALLASNPPPEIAQFARQQITALTGAAPPAAPAAGAAADGPVIDVAISVADGLLPESLGPSSFVYLFARAAAGGPPIAARQIPIGELPGSFELSNANAMLGGSLAGQGKLTVVARISVSGQAIAQPGDVFGEAEIDPAAEESVSILIDQVVPAD